jgi:hypothetical protein
MSRPWTGYLAGAAFALFATTGAVAYAQSAPAAVEKQADADAARAPKVERHEMRREERRIVIQDGDRHFEMAGGHHMDMSEHLRTMLQLKPSQEAALTAYLAAVKPDHAHQHVMAMSDHEGPGRDEKAKTTTERLADMEKRMVESQAQAHARIEATRKFYSQLEPSQKKVFDEMPMLMIGPIGPIGPMMLPGPMKVRFEHGPGETFEYRLERHGVPPVPPAPPIPPVPPVPPRS